MSPGLCATDVVLFTADVSEEKPPLPGEPTVAIAALTYVIVAAMSEFACGYAPDATNVNVPVIVSPATFMYRRSPVLRFSASVPRVAFPKLVILKPPQLMFALGEFEPSRRMKGDTPVVRAIGSHAVPSQTLKVFVVGSHHKVPSDADVGAVDKTIEIGGAMKEP